MKSRQWCMLKYARIQQGKKLKGTCDFNNSFLYLIDSVASPEMVVRRASEVVTQLQGHFIMDEVTITEFEDPHVVEDVAMVTLCNVECNKRKDHVSNTNI